MVCKMLFFNYKDSLKPFFEKNPLENFQITFIKENLNEQILDLLRDENFETAVAVSIDENSRVSDKILDKFKNLRVVATRSKNYEHIDLNYCIQKNIAVVNVENYKPDSEYFNLNSSFRAITSVLCGDKSCRVI